MELAHAELRELAAGVLGGQKGTPTLQPTALVHEAWIKLGGRLANVDSRPHFFALAARAMRQVLTDYVRAQAAVKRGGDRQALTLVEDAVAAKQVQFDLIDFSDALDRLRSLNERHADVLTLRLLGGLSVTEVAEITGVSSRTVKSDWVTARAWMVTQLQDDDA